MLLITADPLALSGGAWMVVRRGIGLQTRQSHHKLSGLFFIEFICLIRVAVRGHWDMVVIWVHGSSFLDLTSWTLLLDFSGSESALGAGFCFCKYLQKCAVCYGRRSMRKGWQLLEEVSGGKGGRGGGLRRVGGPTLDESSAVHYSGLIQKEELLPQHQSKFWMLVSQRRESRLSTLTIPDTATGQYNVVYAMLYSIQNDGITQHTALVYNRYMAPPWLVSCIERSVLIPE